MNKKFFLILAAVILLTSGAFALGVTPGRTTINFEPGTEKAFSFSVVNSEGKDFGLSFVVDGDLGKYVTLSESTIQMGAEEASRKIEANLSFPFYLSPGAHYAKIFVLERANAGSGETTVGAVVGVVTEVRVFVPYPGKYLEFGVNILEPDENGAIVFLLPAINRGSEDILRAFAVLEVFDLEGKKIATINTNEVAVPASERREFVGKLEEEIPEGRYNLSISVYLDGDIIKVDRTLVVGEPLLDLREIRVSDFKLGGIAKFEVVAENRWNEPQTGVYTKLILYGSSGEIIAEFSSPVQDVLPKKQAVFSSYWDSLGVSKGTYDAVLLLGQGQKMSEKRFKLDVQDDRINVIGVSYVISSNDSTTFKAGGIILLLVTAIVILIIINILWFLFIRKKLLGGRRK